MRVPRFAAIAGFVAAALIALASVVGVTAPSIYARETASWRTQGMAQDWADLFVAAPWLAVSAWLAWRGSRRGALLLGGGLAYAAYAFTIYAFAMHFNALFLVYVAILGVSGFGLIALLRGLDREGVAAWFDRGAPRGAAGIALMAAAVVFAGLWLAEIVPALVRGTDPPALAEAGLITNPVHVLDLAFVLPLLFVAGVLLRRGEDRGFVLGSILLGFSVLMDVALVAMMVALHEGGISSDAVVPVVFSAVTIAFAVLLVRLMRGVISGHARAAQVLRGGAAPAQALRGR